MVHTSHIIKSITLKYLFRAELIIRSKNESYVLINIFYLKKCFHNRKERRIRNLKIYNRKIAVTTFRQKIYYLKASFIP